MKLLKLKHKPNNHDHIQYCRRTADWGCAHWCATRKQIGRWKKQTWKIRNRTSTSSTDAHIPHAFLGQHLRVSVFMRLRGLCVWNAVGCALELNSARMSQGHAASWSRLTGQNTGYIPRSIAWTTVSQPPSWGSCFSHAVSKQAA